MRVIRVADIEVDADALSVESYRLHGQERTLIVLNALELLLLIPVKRKLFCTRLCDEYALYTVEYCLHAIRDIAEYARNAEHCRNAEAAGEDRGVGGHAAHLRHNARNT